MPYIVREGDPTTNGGFVLSASATELMELRRFARMGDPVWCSACASVGYIAEGNPTYIDELIAVATHGHLVHCGCKPGTNTLIASQQVIQADMDAAIAIPADLAEQAKSQADRINRSIKDGTMRCHLFAPIPDTL
ncbi:PAAR domain-containing protein [Pseudomonas sp. DWP3-1-2]|uniref:PAAR domain-containing protein n=1 Tax=Pseudomonas sp. DWP3-1-2 TaxID=2804645 RepID=UPI003CFAFF4E